MGGVVPLDVEIGGALLEFGTLHAGSAFVVLGLVDLTAGGLEEELEELQEGDLGVAVGTLLEGQGVVHPFQFLLVGGVEAHAARRNDAVVGVHLHHQPHLLPSRSTCLSS